ncbi:hypothetical protein ADK55_12220 [Streptomyces sp. WM4235]|uniref:hypothetical protein n=1 Tax=Streptomyces sp. WM4235 TaxID=1415551 RepID=UPI0006AF985B|nr:hypothetical protein [Streptomyces sp. WM4235]KOU58011.1 hypothetical protein ADK55_12220 [Streptomyces sp. WM4235]
MKIVTSSTLAVAALLLAAVPASADILDIGREGSDEDLISSEPGRGEILGAVGSEDDSTINLLHLRNKDLVDRVVKIGADRHRHGRRT